MFTNVLRLWVRTFDYLTPAVACIYVPRDLPMPPFEDGFLTEPFDDVRAAIRWRYSEQRTLLLQINRLSVKNQHSLEIHREDKREVYAAVLFARTLSTTQGAVHMLERGLVPQARTLLRAALETLFALTAIANDPPVVDKLIETYNVERARAARNVGLWKDPGLREIAAAEKASGRLRQFLDSSAATISTLTLAQKGGLEDWYRTVYMILSWSVHGTAIDLERHIVLGGDGDIAEFRNEPEVDNQRSSWECAIEVQLKALRALRKIFPSVDESAIEPLEAAFQGLAANLKC